MNDITLIQMKILVERAVRPVRASIARKRKMREELLAHVSAVFDEELRGGDETAALARTAQRFGDPGDLTRQLQAAVPTSDRAAYYIERFAGVPTRESVLRRALRYAGVVGAFCGIFLVFFVILIGRGDEWLTLARLPSNLAPLFLAFLVFCATLLEQAMRKALFGPRGPSWPRIIAIGVATWLLVPAVNFAWCLVLGVGFLASLFEVLPLLLTGLLAPLALLIVVRACITEIRYLEEWASLTID